MLPHPHRGRCVRCVARNGRHRRCRFKAPCFSCKAAPNSSRNISRRSAISGARGFDVVSFDWRGQGGSERLLRNPKKGHVRRFSDYHLDLDAAFAEMEARSSPKPWFVRRSFHGRGDISGAPRPRGNAGASRRADFADDRLLAEDCASLRGRDRLHACGLRLGTLLRSGRWSRLDHHDAVRK